MSDFPLAPTIAPPYPVPTTMPKARRIKPRYYVTLNRDNVELVYLRHGPRSLSPLIDKLLERHLKNTLPPATKEG